MVKKIIIILMAVLMLASCANTNVIDEPTEYTEIAISAEATEVFEYESEETIETEDTVDAIETELEEVCANHESSKDETETAVVSEVPKYNQLDYYYVPYGNYGTVCSHGCGITCLAMVATYLLDDPTMTPDVLAKQFGHYNTEWGSAWGLFIDSAAILGLGEVRQVHDWTQGIEEALRNGSLVISNQMNGVFTNGGHYILLVGMTEDGKVMVHDPNGANWNSNTYMMDGFENGFNVTTVSCTSTAYWIYQPKVTHNE